MADAAGEQAQEEPEQLEIALQKVEVVGAQDGYRVVRLQTSRGPVLTHY